MADMNKKKEKLRKLATTAIFQRLTYNHDGTKYEMLQPSIKRRTEIRESCFRSVGSFDTVKFQVLMVIECTVVPGTDEKLFELADFDSLANQPAGSVADGLWATMMADQKSSELALAKKLYPNLENSDSQ